MLYCHVINTAADDQQLRLLVLLASSMRLVIVSVVSDWS